MLLDRAKVYYYLGSPQLHVQAGILFQRRVDRLNFISTSSNSLPKFESIKTEAGNWLTQLATGVVYMIYVIVSVWLLTISLGL
jgi:hypothetical protein